MHFYTNVYSYTYIHVYNTNTFIQLLKVPMEQIAIQIQLHLSGCDLLGLFSPEKRKLRGGSHQCI